MYDYRKKLKEEEEDQALTSEIVTLLFQGHQGEEHLCLLAVDAFLQHFSLDLQT